MYILNIAIAMKKISVNELREFMFENFYKPIGYVQEKSHYSKLIMKLF